MPVLSQRILIPVFPFGRVAAGKDIRGLGTTEGHIRRREDIDSGNVVIGSHDILEHAVQVLRCAESIISGELRIFFRVGSQILDYGIVVLI